MRNRMIFGLAAVLALLFIATTAGAQELKFDGYINSGLGVVVDNADGSDPYLKAFGVDGESNGYRFRLNGSYTNEAKNAGARLRLQSQRNLTISSSANLNVNVNKIYDENGDLIDDYSGTGTASGNVTNTYGYFSLAYAYGWVSFLDNMITLTGGIVDDGTYATADWWFNDDLGEGLGMLLKVAPVDGLSLGIGAYTISQQSGGSNNILTVGGNLPNFRDVTPKLAQAKYTFNAAYTMPDTFRFGVSYRPQNRAAWVGSSASSIINTSYEDYANGGNYESAQLITEFRFLGMKGLTAVVAGIFDKMNDFSDNGTITLSETFGYKASDELNLGLNAVQFLYQNDNNASLLFNPWVSYAVSKDIIPRLDLVYFMGGQSKMVRADTQWERRGFAVVPSSDSDKVLSVFSARPSVKINLDSKTFVEIGDMINYDFGNYDNAYGDEKARLTNVFYVDMKFSF